MNRSFFSSEFSKFFKLLWLLFRWFTWRHWVRSFRSTLVLVGILSLGVAVFVSIRLATQAAVSGFSLFSDSLTGQSDWVLVPDSGSIPDSALSEIRETLGSLPISLFPVVETTAVESIAKGPSDRDKGVLFQLVGVDLMALQNLLYLEPEQKGGSFRNAGEEGFNFDSDEGESLVQMLNRADRVFISRKYSQKHNIVVGDSLAVLIHDEPVNLTVQGILPEYEFRATVPENLMLMDLPAVQALADQPGRIDRIEVRLPEGNERGEDLEWAESRLKALSRGRWAVVSPQTRRDTGKNMTMAFRFNLTALSFLALLVGIYLILQALEAAVVRRRSEIAVLRSMGVPQLMIQIAWLVESSALAMTGSLLGIIFGFLGARYSVEAVAGTVNALYYNTTRAATRMDSGTIAFSLCIGLGAGLLAGWIPARDAAMTPPAQVLQRGLRTRGLKILDSPGLGVLMLLLGTVCYFLPPIVLSSGGPQLPIAGYLCALFWLVGAGACSGMLFWVFRNFRPSVLRNSPVILCGISPLRQATGRHRLAVAGFMAAVSMAVGMSILIFSFETTMNRWIQEILKADVFVSTHGLRNASGRNRIQENTWRELSQHPLVDAYEVSFFHPIRIQGKETFLVGSIWTHPDLRRGNIWIDPPTGDSSKADAPNGVISVTISESFSERFSNVKGDLLELPTPSGIRTVRVGGVFAEYGNERGSITAPGESIAEWFQDRKAGSLALKLKSGTDQDRLIREWQTDYPGLYVRTNAGLKDEILTIFRQTFSVTVVMKGIGIIVAVAGLVLSLISLQRERRRETAVLLQLGMLRRQVAAAVGIEGLCLTALGLGAGMVLSFFLGRLLIFVINKQSFGWTLSFEIPYLDLALFSGLMLGVSGCVCYGVGYWGSRLTADREE